MNIEIPDELYQRCIEYLQRNAGTLGDTSVERFVWNTLEQATWENRGVTGTLGQNMKDSLTQCFNRPKFDHDLSMAAAHAQALGTPLSCKFIGVGVPRLREINDRYGLQQGNQLLGEIAGQLMRYFQPAPVYRTEGDEFVVWIDERETRPLSEMPTLSAMRLAIIDLTIMLDGYTLGEVGYRIREKIRTGIREGTEQGQMM